MSGEPLVPPIASPTDPNPEATQYWYTFGLDIQKIMTTGDIMQGIAERIKRRFEEQAATPEPVPPPT